VTGTPLRGAGRWVLATGLALLLFLAATAPILAAEPAATGSTGGDPRSPGQGPGLVGDPAFALGVVVLVGLVSLGLSLAYVRATNPRTGEGPR
jgi:hypothetical protein